MINDLPIGVFDSGVGGLTVLEELKKMMPNEDYIYVADQGNCPYGTKSDEEIKKCVINVVKFLCEQNVKAIVIACNTASNFINDIKKEITIPIFSVIEVTADCAIKTTKNKRVGVIATNTTIKKGKYKEILEKNKITSFNIPCSNFVEIVEENRIDSPSTQQIIDEKLIELKNEDIDTLIYGCTHFSLLEKPIKKVLGNINYISSGLPMGIELSRYLTENNMLTIKNKNGVIKIYTTGDKGQAIKTMQWFKTEHNPVEKINI